MTLRLLPCSVLVAAVVSGQIPVGSAQAGPAGPPNQAGTNAPGQSPTPSEPPKEQPPASIEGQVLNSVTGEPVKKATLILTPEQRSPDMMTPYSTTTDANGRFAMSNIGAGNYRLMAERTGYVRSNYGARSITGPGATLSLAPNQALKQISFRLQPHAVMSGRILDEDGEPLAYVQVQVLTHRYMQGKKQLMPAGGSSTNDLGEYRIFGLAPGRYYLSATYRPQTMAWQTVDRTAGAGPNQQEEGYAPTYYPGSNDSSSAVPIQVTAGRPLTNVDVKLLRTRTLRIRGRVLNMQPPSRTMIMLMQRESNGFGFFERNMTSVQGREGKFELRGVTPGPYYLIAQYFEDNTTRYFARIPVDVGSANLDGIEVTVKPGVEVTGTVRVEGETEVNLSQINITLQPKDFTPFGGGGMSRVKDDGTFTIRNAAPDTYRIGVFGGGELVYVKSVQAGQQEAKNGEVAIVDGAPPALTVVLSAAGGQLSGQVNAPSNSGKPASTQGSTIVLVPSSDKREVQQLYKVATTDQNGKYSFKSIAPGEYKLFAWDDVESGAWQDAEFLARFENKGKTIAVKEKDILTADIDLLKAEDTQSGQ